MNKLVLAIPLFLLLAMPSLATTINITDIGDSIVWSYASRVYLNAGNTSSHNINSGPSNMNSYAYIMFNTSLVPSDATVNTAYLYMQKSAGVGGSYFLAYNTSPYNTTGTVLWNEGNLQQTNCSSNGTGAACNLDHNITWTNRPALGTLQDNISINASNNLYRWNITNALKSAAAAGIPMAIVVKNTRDNATVNINQMFYSKEGSVPPYVTVDFTTSNNCSTTIIGSYCDQSDPLLRTIITTPDYTCENDLYYTCPEGSKCTQITPQVNITTPLIENFTDCSKCTYTYTTALGFFPLFLWTNCPNNPECLPVLGNQSNVFTSSCLWGPANPLLVTCPSTFTTPTSTIPASADYYTAGCFNSQLGWVPVVIDQNGNQTTILNLTQDIFGENTTLATPHREDCPANTTSLCYNDACQQVTCQSSIAAVSCSSASGYTDQLVCAMGGMLGVTDIGNSKFIASILFSFIIAIAVLAALNYYGVDGESMGMVFMMSLLMLTIMFTFIGWFPSWIMIILMVLGALMVAKMLKVV